MKDKSLIPFAGDKKVRQRLRELDKEFASIMVLIGIGFSKIFEGIVAILTELYPILLFGVNISDFTWWTVYTVAWCIVFIYELNEAAVETVEEVAETVDDVVDD